MTRQEWNDLKIGDICKLMRGKSEGQLGKVVYISGDAACLESLDGENFSTCRNTHQTLTLQNWRNISLLEDES